MDCVEFEQNQFKCLQCCLSGQNFNVLLGAIILSQKGKKGKQKCTEKCSIINSKCNNEIQVQYVSLLNKLDDKCDSMAENYYKLSLLGIKL